MLYKPWGVTNAIILIFLLGCGNIYQDILVSAVVDGDTLRLSNGERVDLIGLDCPEAYEGRKLNEDVGRTQFSSATLQAFGISALNFTKKLVEGKKVRLQFDLKRTNKKGRLTAYVFLMDGTFVNAKILEEGYGFYVKDPVNERYNDLFERLHREAREKKKGIFASGENLRW